MATASMAGASTNNGVVADDGVNSSDGINELLAPVSTLDEPVGETIMRDVRAVGTKLRAVLMPLDRSVSFILFHPSCFCRVTICNDAIPSHFCTTSLAPFSHLYTNAHFKATIWLCQCPTRRRCQSKYPSTKCIKSITRLGLVGSIINMSIIGNNTECQSTCNTNLTCLYYSLYCNVGGCHSCDNQCSIIRCIHVNISKCLRTGILCFPTDSVSIPNCHIA